MGEVVTPEVLKRIFKNRFFTNQTRGDIMGEVLDPEFWIGSDPVNANYEPKEWSPDSTLGRNLEGDIANLQKAPSYADAQMQRGLSAAIQGASAVANSQRGVAPALAARIGAQQGGQMGLQAAQIGAALRAQEMAQRQQQIAVYRGLQMQRDEQSRLYNAMYNQAKQQQALANVRPGTGGWVGDLLNSAPKFLGNLNWGSGTSDEESDSTAVGDGDSWGSEGF